MLSKQFTFTLQQFYRASWQILFDMKNTYYNIQNEIPSELNSTQTSLPKGSVISQSQKLKHEDKLRQIQNERAYLNLKHFVSTEAMINSNQLKEILNSKNNPILYEQFLIIMAQEVQCQSKTINDQLQQFINQEKDFINNNIEIMTLQQIMKKEHIYYQEFLQDVQERFSKENTSYQILKEDKLLFQILSKEDLNDQEMIILQNNLSVQIKLVSKQMGNDLRTKYENCKKKGFQQTLDELIERKEIIFFDYILDLQEIQFMDLNSKYFKSFIENIHVDKGKILGLSPLLQLVLQKDLKLLELQKRSKN